LGLKEGEMAMKKTVFVLILAIVLLAVFGPDAKAQGLKEASTSFNIVYSGTFKALPMGQERLQFTYEIMGVAIGDTPEDFHHNASFRCVGGFHAERASSKTIVVPASLHARMATKYSRLIKPLAKWGERPRGLLPSLVVQGNWSAYRVTASFRDLLCGLLPKERSRAMPGGRASINCHK